MLTSDSDSREPPNQAATRPSPACTTVDAWQDREGATWKMNSSETRPGG